MILFITRARLDLSKVFVRFLSSTIRTINATSLPLALNENVVIYLVGGLPDSFRPLVLKQVLLIRDANFSSSSSLPHTKMCSVVIKNSFLERREAGKNWKLSAPDVKGVEQKIHQTSTRVPCTARGGARHCQQNEVVTTDFYFFQKTDMYAKLIFCTWNHIVSFLHSYHF